MTNLNQPSELDFLGQLDNYVKQRGKPPKTREEALAGSLPPVDALDDALIDKRLSRFMRAAWGIVEPGADFISGWHIDAICDHLEAVAKGEIKRLIINIPPRCCKSLTVAIFWPAWVWSWRPQTRWIFASHNQQFATRDSVKMRRLIESDWYQRRYPNVRLETDQNAKSFYQNTMAGQRFAIGVGGGMTGEGGDILVVDDPLNANEAIFSAAARQEAIEWWGPTMATRLNPGSPIAARLVIMQRLHEGDLTGHLLKQRENYLEAIEKQRAQGIETLTDTEIDFDAIDYEVLCLPAEYIPNHPITSHTSLKFEDPRKDRGELLWPPGLPKSKINSLRVELGSYAASGQLDQMPSPEGGGKLPRKWFRLVSKAEWPTSFEKIISSWDLAYEDKKTSDYCAGFVLGRNRSNIYVINRAKRQMEFVDQLRAILTFNKLYPNTAIYIEKAANASSIHSTLKDQIPGIVLVPPVGSKMARAMAWQPHLESGCIHLPAWEPWIDDFLGECEVFPQGKHDDQVDAISLGINTLINEPSAIPQLDTSEAHSSWDY